MMPYFFLLILAFLSTHSLPKADDHAIYLSTLTLSDEIPGATPGTPILTVRVFSDDLRDAIRNAFPDQQSVSEETLCAQHRDQVNAYFSKHLILKTETRQATQSTHSSLSASSEEMQISLILTEMSRESDVITVSWFASLPKGCKTLTIKADYLMELFPTQTQMVTVKLNGSQQMLRLVHGKSLGGVVVTE